MTDLLKYIEQLSEPEVRDMFKEHLKNQQAITSAEIARAITGEGKPGVYLSVTEMNIDMLRKKCDEILAIANKLAAKHVRGAKACSMCGAAAYMGTFQHNEGCEVLKLEAYK